MEAELSTCIKALFDNADDPMNKVLIADYEDYNIRAEAFVKCMEDGGVVRTMQIVFSYLLLDWIHVFPATTYITLLAITSLG